jgi:general secretion pathway protein K
LPNRVKLSSQRGAAIIVALFVTTLVAVAAVAMIDRLRMDLRRTELLMNDIQGNLYAQGSIDWAMEQLNNNWKQKKANQLIDLTPIQSPINEVNNAAIYSIIYDPEGLFNLNNLANIDYQDNFQKLIQTVHPETNQDTAQNIILAIRDWISPGSNSGLDEYYSNQTPAYRAPHRPMVSISELRLVKGVSPELYAALSPFISALPEPTRININSAPAQVLISLNPTMSLASAKAIEQFRKTTPFPTTQSYLQFDIVKNNPVQENKISVTSSYFLVKTSVKVAKQETILYTMLHRILKNAEPLTLELWQSKGTL